MSESREAIQNSPAEVRGGVGDSLLGIFDNAASAPLSDQRIQLIDNDLFELENISNELGATGSGMLERS